MNREKAPIHTEKQSPLESHPEVEKKVVALNIGSDREPNPSDHDEEHVLTSTDTTVDNESEKQVIIGDSEQETDRSSKRKKLEPNPNKIRMVLKILLMVGATISVLGVAGILYLNKDKTLDYLDFTNGSNPQSEADPQLLKLNIEIDKLKGELLKLANLPEQIRVLTEQNDLMKLMIEQLKNELKVEVEAFYKKSQEREQRIAQIQNELETVISEQKGDREHLEKFRTELAEIDAIQDKEILHIQNKFQELKKITDRMDSSDKKVTQEASKKSRQEKPKSSPVLDAPITSSEVNTLGYLRLNTIQTFGNQRVAIFSDGVSGAIQVIEGDLLGKFKITRITNEQVTAVDHLGNTYNVTRGER